MEQKTTQNENKEQESPYLKVKDKGSMKLVITTEYLIERLEGILTSQAQTFQEKTTPNLILGNRLDEFTQEVLATQKKSKEQQDTSNKQNT